MNSLEKTLPQAFRLGVPLLGITTSDPAQTESTLQHVCQDLDPHSLIRWDIARGLTSLNTTGADEVARILADKDPAMFLGQNGAIEYLLAIQQLSTDCICLLHNAHRFLEDPMVMQAVWNLRDTFKAIGASLILCGTSLQLPLELQSDVLILDDPLPTRETLGELITELHTDADLTVPDSKILAQAEQALLGLSTFAAEQSTVLALSTKGLCLDKLWARKRQAISQTQGLSVLEENITFDDIRGVQQVRQFLIQLNTGKEPPQAIVFIDEIEKALATSVGQAGDSGVSADQLGQLLTYMQDSQAMGILFVGHPGSAKSMVAKAAGKTAGIPTIQLDLGGMKGSLIGESEQTLRQALKVITAISSGVTLFIGTCNNLGILPPELRRRFQLGTFFFDLPDSDESTALWDLYRQKYQIPPEDSLATEVYEGWTGAEIKTCCELAYKLQISLRDAAAFIVPICKAAADRVQTLRQQATGRWLSASYSGFYAGPTQKPSPIRSRRLKVQK